MSSFSNIWKGRLCANESFCGDSAILLSGLFLYKGLGLPIPEDALFRDKIISAADILDAKNAAPSVDSRTRLVKEFFTANTDIAKLPQEIINALLWGTFNESLSRSLRNSSETRLQLFTPFFLGLDARKYATAFAKIVSGAEYMNFLEAFEEPGTAILPWDVLAEAASDWTFTSLLGPFPFIFVLTDNPNGHDYELNTPLCAIRQNSSTAIFLDSEGDRASGNSIPSKKAYRSAFSYISESQEEEARELVSQLRIMTNITTHSLLTASFLKELLP